ncbi:MAG: glycosyltransferase family 2 protein, partial [Thaumarchaeota archaeon]
MEGVNRNERILVCIPAFNEAKHIADIVRNARAYCSEVVVCDDGSVDNTGEIARSAGATIARHSTNKGYGSALKTLFNIAKMKDVDIVVTLDSDGQHNVADIPKIVQPILKGDVDVVVGSRFLTENDSRKVPRYRTFGIKTLTKLANIAAYDDISDSQNGFRAYKKNALSKLDLYEDGMAISTEILIRA